ncbi:hypothetical protein [Paenibacillus amylolyticus]|uniref:hypothetical protein n=1 Tax=Paenibacillus amylolyticus TaxID=1451 RepID=UPI00096DBF74|nr:hypothetical protein [Paenibacillus amylolyticus]OMF47738.1 hypothetical protein BK136_02265 [Paenibacillus amylolyticus]
MTQTLTRKQVLKATGTVLDAMIAVHIFKEPVAPLYLPMIMRDKRYYFIPEYSTDISATYMIGDQFNELDDSQLKHRFMRELIDLDRSGGFGRVHASPSDRCKAALLAVLDL